MRFKTIDQWLAWQEQLHPNPIDLGLHRVKCMLDILGMSKPTYRILTVGGTNGKGSCVALAESMLLAAGYKVGAYTSPHLLRYNERVRVGGVDASDAEFCASFDRLDTARGEMSLTYFEFGTLAALDIFTQRKIEVAVLEVGLGGRLDAVNALDADAALVASVGLDHQDWLGPDRESIGFEKAGIFRGGRPALCGDREPPTSLLNHASDIGADLYVLGRDFDWHPEGEGWTWQGPGGALHGLPKPSLPGRIQFDNAATVLAAIQSLRTALPLDEHALHAGLTRAQVPARFQRITGDVDCIFDVAHNPDAARVLAANLADLPSRGRTLGVFAMFKDKAVEEVASVLAPHIDAWHLGMTDGPRGQSAAALADRVHKVLPEVRVMEHATVPDAYRAARRESRPGDRIVIFGSFQTVGSVLRIF